MKSALPKPYMNFGNAENKIFNVVNFSLSLSDPIESE